MNRSSALPGTDRSWYLPAAAMVALVLLALVSSPSGAQELQLFEPVEQAVRPDNQVQAVRPVQPQANGPAFELVGTSRFGDDYRIRIRARDGQVITVNGAPGTEMPVPGHPGYRLIETGSRNVSIAHPDNAPCVDAPDKGVNCSGNTARLTVATAAPIVPPQAEQPQRRRDRRGGGNGAGNGDGNDNAEAPQNPFAAALRAARERNPEDEAVMRAQAERFERRRIDPSQVPEGYRVVRTPFGDRVIEIQQQ